MFRVLDNLEYARSMVEQGRFRFGNLSKYVQMEDAIRRDETEGIGKRRVSQMVERVVVDKDLNAIKRVDLVPGEMTTHTSTATPSTSAVSPRPNRRIYATCLRNSVSMSFRLTMHASSRRT
jgi:hypothetical protein